MDLTTIDYTIALQVINANIEAIKGIIEVMFFCYIYEFTMRRLDILKVLQKGKSK